MYEWMNISVRQFRLPMMIIGGGASKLKTSTQMCNQEVLAGFELTDVADNYF